MRFKVDQNLPVEIADALRSVGHDAETVYEENLAGTPDPHLATIMQGEARGLVTLDVGFADIRTYPPAEYLGLIVMRPSSQAKPHVVHVFESVVRQLAGRSSGRDAVRAGDVLSLMNRRAMRPPANERCAWQASCVHARSARMFVDAPASEPRAFGRRIDVRVRIVALVALLLSGPAVSAACSCRAGGSALEAVGAADGVFIGTVVGTRPSLRHPLSGEVLRIRVDSAWKGIHSASVLLEQERGWSCALRLKPGERALFLVDLQSGSPLASYCMGYQFGQDSLRAAATSLGSPVTPRFRWLILPLWWPGWGLVVILALVLWRIRRRRLAAA